jgi:hypothetical protein
MNMPNDVAEYGNAFAYCCIYYAQCYAITEEATENLRTVPQSNQELSSATTSTRIFASVISMASDVPPQHLALTGGDLRSGFTANVIFPATGTYYVNVHGVISNSYQTVTVSQNTTIEASAPVPPLTKSPRRIMTWQM